ncbi:unnamed protein product [Brassica rapa subsp. trilocularis]|uniref:(rape) hypothetical protein n=1 Tax=Brassica napus TaxID=3708 RepID=A0A816TR34_BRANA|nr:unnamed protein product [Brassica napus]
MTMSIPTSFFESPILGSKGASSSFCFQSYVKPFRSSVYVPISQITSTTKCIKIKDKQVFVLQSKLFIKMQHHTPNHKHIKDTLFESSRIIISYRMLQVTKG